MSKNIFKLDINIASSDKALNTKEYTPEAKTYDDILKERLQILKDIHASKNLADILAAEKLLLATQVVKTKEQKQSMEKAVEDFESGARSLSLVNDKEGYKKADSTYMKKDRDKPEGLPLDSFRKLLNSQIARISNSLKTHEISKIQAKILKQREGNLYLARELYKEMQREALRPDTPEETARKEKATVKELARKEKADDMRNLSIEEFRKKHPESVKEAEALEFYVANLSSITNANFRAQMMEKCKADLADIIERGEKLPNILPDISIKP